MITTPKKKIISNLSKNGVTIIRSGKLLKSPERYDEYNENNDKYFKKYKIIR
jgi:hypothetical protein